MASSGCWPLGGNSAEQLFMGWGFAQHENWVPRASASKAQSEVTRPLMTSLKSPLCHLTHSIGQASH